MREDILENIEEEIAQLKTEEQRKLLQDLPRILKIPLDDLLLLKIAENSLDFWNNPEDRIYDNL